MGDEVHFDVTMEDLLAITTALTAYLRNLEMTVHEATGGEKTWVEQEMAHVRQLRTRIAQSPMLSPSHSA